MADLEARPATRAKSDTDRWRRVSVTRASEIIIVVLSHNVGAAMSSSQPEELKTGNAIDACCHPHDQPIALSLGSQAGVRRSLLRLIRNDNRAYFDMFKGFHEKALLSALAISVNIILLSSCTGHEGNSTARRQTQHAPFIARTPPWHGTWPPGPPGVPNMAPYQTPLPGKFRHHWILPKGCSKVKASNPQESSRRRTRYSIRCVRQTAAPTAIPR